MQTITAILEKMTLFKGVLGCALVEADTGMVWYHAGLSSMEQVGEAAVELWRAQNRVSSQLGMLGELKFASYNYGKRVIGLIPCDIESGVILVCLVESPGMAWSEWMKKIPALRQAVRAVNQKALVAALQT